MFVDSMNISNLYLSGIGGDYDGDTVTIKGIYTEEANKELDKIMNSKYNFKAIQSLFNLTMTLSSDGSKMTASKDIKFA